MILFLGACVFISYCTSASSVSLNRKEYLFLFDDPNLFDDPQLPINFRESGAEYTDYCVKQAQCVSLNSSTCFGVKIPYTRTSLSLVSDVTTQEDAQESLQRWQKSLIHIPKCWAVVQPFLCALFFPKCEDGNVVLPLKEMCDVIQHPCRILNTTNLWPPEFNCSLYEQEKCKNDMRGLKFNTTSRCMSPLVQTEQESSYYEGIEGCGVQCRDPFFSDDNRQDIQTTVKTGAVLAFLSGLFAVMTFILNWKSTKRYPSTLAIFYSNIGYLLVSSGYLYQFTLASDDYTICHKDGTLRTSEPSTRENLSCVVNFVFVYYPQIAGIIWFIFFAYEWHLSLKDIVEGRIKDKKNERSSYCHIVAWSLPLILTITIMVFKEVDGDSLLGVCSVGEVNKQFRLVFLLVPMSFSTIGLFLIIKVVVTLICLKRTGQEHITMKANKKIRASIVRAAIFSIFISFCGAITFIYHIYDYQHREEWKQSFRSFIICKLISDDVERCRMQDQPSVLMVQLRVMALFGTHISMASWVCTKSTLKTWSNFFNMLLNKEIQESNTVTKHKLIALAYAKRKQFDNEGKFTIDMSNTPQDPVGLNFKLNSLASKYSDSSWAKMIPKLITRRGALAAVSRSNSSQRRDSSSEISINVRRFSVESRRQSLDSTVSVQGFELTKTIRKNGQNIRHSRKDFNYMQSSTKLTSWKGSNSSQINYFRGSNSSQINNFRGSNSSEINNLEIEVLKALSIGNIDKSPKNFGPNMNRRFAIATIEKDDLELLDLGSRLCNCSDDDFSSSSEDETDPLFAKSASVEQESENLQE